MNEHLNKTYLYGALMAVAALGCIIGASTVNDSVRRPVPMPLGEAMTFQQTHKKSYVRLHCAPDWQHILYTARANDDIYSRPELLTRFSPVHGIPLLTPEGLKIDQLNGLEGAYVSVAGPADIARDASTGGYLITVKDETESFYVPFAKYHLLSRRLLASC